MPETTDVLEVSTAIADLAPEWEVLADELATSPFLRPGWIQAWMDAFGNDAATILAARRGGRLVGILPLQRHRGSLLSPTNWHTPRFGPLAVDRTALNALIGGALEAATGRVDLSFLNGGSATVDSCRRRALAGGAWCEDRVIQRSPYLELEGDWDEYLGSLPARRRSKIRRARRRLEESGEASLRVEDGSSDLQGALQEGFRIEAAGWKGSAGTAIVAEPATRGFYEAVARWAADRGWLRLTFLETGGKPVAFGFGIEDGSCHYDLKNGFDPDYSYSSPGILLAEERIRRSFANGLARYDFLGNADRHKLDWTSTCRAQTRLQIFPPSARGRLERAAWLQGRPLAKRLISLADRKRRRHGGPGQDQPK